MLPVWIFTPTEHIYYHQLYDGRVNLQVHWRFTFLVLNYSEAGLSY